MPVPVSMILLGLLTACNSQKTDGAAQPSPGNIDSQKKKILKDSPAEVAGGSILIRSGSTLATSPDCNGADYCGDAGGPPTFDFQNLSFSPIDPAHGFRIHVKNKKPKEAIEVCSNAQCDFASDWDGTKYYVFLKNGYKVDPHAPKDHPATIETHFHDDNDCPGGVEDKKCDTAAKFTIDVPKRPGSPQAVSQSAKCDDPSPNNECIVFMGKTN